MDANEVLLENLNDVTRLATSFAYRFGYDPDDMVQTACLYFLERWDSRPEGMPVANFIRCYINYRLIDVTKNGQKKKHTQTKDGFVDRSTNPEVSVWCLFDDLTEDAADLLGIFLDAPAEIRNALRADNGHKRSVSIVGQWFRSRGWTRDRISQAYRELEAACTN